MQLSDIVVPAENLEDILELVEEEMKKRPNEAKPPVSFHGAENVLDALPHLFRGFD